MKLRYGILFLLFLSLLLSFAQLKKKAATASEKEKEGAERQLENVTVNNDHSEEVHAAGILC